MKMIFLDFETQSDVDISLGPRAYVRGEGFRPVLLAWAVDSGRVNVTDDFSRIPGPLADALLRPCFVVAHNAEFDRAVFETVFGVSGLDWIDTAALCRYYSIPASLDGAAGFFGLGRKHQTGKEVLKKMLKGAELSRAEGSELRKYAAQDVRLLRDIYHSSPGTWHSMDGFAQAVLAMTLKMNRAGIAVDHARIGVLLRAITAEKDRARVQAVKQFGTYGKDEKPVASSADQVKKYLSKAGFPVESIQEKELENLLGMTDRKLPTKCRDLLLFYREIQSRGADKLQSIHDARLTRIWDSSIYHGTHTGRHAGGGLNLLNVKRYSNGDDSRPFDRALKTIVKTAERGTRVKRLSSLLWGCFEPEHKNVVVRSDLSAIEPRVGAWLRSDSKTLQIYRDADAGTGLDEYTIFGNSMNFPKEISRNLSKIVILAACYGMAFETFRAQCRSYGIKDPGETESKRILDGYHQRNPSVKRAWFDLIKTAVRTIETGGFLQSHNVAFSRVILGRRPFLALTLPSGRRKYYADVAVETNASGWKTFSYLDARRGFRVKVAPAALYENIVQAVAFDVAAEKAVKIQGFASVKLIIHDELNVSARKSDVSRIQKIMKAPVLWLPGMPVNSKTVVCSSFHKGDLI